MDDHSAASLGARLSVVDPLTGELTTKTDVQEGVHLGVSSKVDEVGLEEHAGVALNGVDIFCEDVGDCEAWAEALRPESCSTVAAETVHEAGRGQELRTTWFVRPLGTGEVGHAGAHGELRVLAHVHVHMT